MTNGKKALTVYLYPDQVEKLHRLCNGKRKLTYGACIGDLIDAVVEPNEVKDDA